MPDKIVGFRIYFIDDDNSLFVSTESVPHQADCPGRNTARAIVVSIGLPQHQDLAIGCRAGGQAVFLAAAVIQVDDTAYGLAGAGADLHSRP
jgi:hypothetical protein